MLDASRAIAFDERLPVHPGLDPRLTIGAPAVGVDDVGAFAGYVAELSLAPGEPLDVCAATRGDEPCFADVYRVTGCRDAGFEPALELVERAPVQLHPDRYPMGSVPQPLVPGGADADGCGWTPQRLYDAVPDTWTSGLYLVQLTGADEPTGRVSERLGQDALLVVRPAAPTSTALLQLGVATWSAYHLWGNRDLYGGLTADGQWDFGLRTPRVSFDRPGIGLGTFNQSVWGPGKGAYTFKFLEWTAAEGIALDLCTGIDVHAGRVRLDDYELLLTVGHDEYWSRQQWDAVEGFVARGGNAAFLGGNLAYWQVRISDDGHVVECHKRGNAGGISMPIGEPLDPHYRDPSGHPGHDNGDVTVEFCAAPLHRSTTALTGVSMRFEDPAPDGDPLCVGAAWWWEDLGGPSRPALGFTVANADHWAFAGTGLEDGDVFGEDQKVVGFECDGLDAELVGDALVLSGRDDPRPGTEVIAYADARDWAEVDYAGPVPTPTPGRRSNEATIGGVVTMVSIVTPSGGEIFTAPTTDWVFALVPTIDYTRYREVHPAVNPASPACQAITRNVIRRLARLGDER